MRGRRRVLLLSGFGVVAGLAVWGSTAFACSPNARLSYPAPREPEAANGPTTASGPAGSEVTLYGAEYVFADHSTGPVQVVWNSLTPLASVAGPSFSVRVKIPDAPPGLYFINAVLREPNGDVVGSSSVTYKVTAPATAPPPSGGTSSTGPSSEPSTQTQNPTPTPTGEAAPTPPQSQGTTSNAAPTPVQTAAPSTGTTSSGSTASPVAAPAVATAPAGPSAASSSPTRAPQAARPTGAPPTATGAAPAPGATALALAPSALAPAQGPSLAPTLEGGVPADSAQQREESAATKAMGLVDADGASQSRRGSSFSVGVVLLGIGLVTMFASFFAAHVRRRRALATMVAD